MSIDFNDDESRRRHQQIIAICLANTRGEAINSKRAEWHWSTNMEPPATKEEIRAAVTEYMMIAEWIKAYRDFYGEGSVN